MRARDAKVTLTGWWLPLLKVKTQNKATYSYLTAALFRFHYFGNASLNPQITPLHYTALFLLPFLTASFSPIIVPSNFPLERTIFFSVLPSWTPPTPYALAFSSLNPLFSLFQSLFKHSFRFAQSKMLSHSLPGRHLFLTLKKLSIILSPFLKKYEHLLLSIYFLSFYSAACLDETISVHVVISSQAAA